MCRIVSSLSFPGRVALRGSGRNASRNRVRMGHSASPLVRFARTRAPLPAHGVGRARPGARPGARGGRRGQPPPSRHRLPEGVRFLHFTCEGPGRIVRRWGSENGARGRARGAGAAGSGLIGSWSGVRETLWPRKRRSRARSGRGAGRIGAKPPRRHAPVPLRQSPRRRYAGIRARRAAHSLSGRTGVRSRPRRAPSPPSSRSGRRARW